MIELPYGSPEDDLALFKSHFNLPEESASLLDEDGEFRRWCFNYCKFRFSCSLGEFKKWRDTGLVTNFAYDRKMETVFINFQTATHPQFIACLYTLRKLAAGERSKNPSITLHDFPYTFCEGLDSLQDLSGEWVTEGHGFYLSSVAHNVYKAKDFKLTRQERLQFEGFTFMDW